MKYLSKISILIIIGILCLSIFSLVPKVQSSSPKVSSVSDGVDDVYASFNGVCELSAIYIGYLDIIHAEVRQTTSNILIFEMTMNSRIPFNPDITVVGYCWQLDMDFNENSGNYGSEYNVRVENDGQGWYACVDVFVSENHYGGSCPFIIKGNTVMVTVRLNQIGNPTTFRWWPNDGCDIRIWKDSDVALHMNDWTDLAQAAVWVKS